MSIQNINVRITDEVRALIAFEVFRTTKDNKKNSRIGSYSSIAKKFGISRSLVKVIAREFNVDRNKEFYGFSMPGNKRRSNKRDIAKVNWTFDSCLKRIRVARRESKLLEVAHESMKVLAELS